MRVSPTNDLIRLLLAPPCAACGATLTTPLVSPVCDACWGAIPPLPPPWCTCCGDALPDGSALICTRCRTTPRHFTAARSAGRYEGPLRTLVHAFKFQRRRALAGPLAVLARGAGAGLLDGAEAVVPVPLHPWRALRRGFNQADDLACRLGPPVWRVLWRRRLGRPQSGLAGDHRRDNVRQAFALAPGRWRARLRGRVVVVVDDVMTTGETADACTGVLLDAGVREVRVITVARAVAGQPPPRRQPPLPWTVPRR